MLVARAGAALGQPRNRQGPGMSVPEIDLAGGKLATHQTRFPSPTFSSPSNQQQGQGLAQRRLPASSAVACLPPGDPS